MNLTFNIITPRRTWFDLISKKNLLLYLILPLFPLDLILLPLVPSYLTGVILYLTIFCCLVFIVLYFLPDILFVFNKNYRIIGQLELSNDCIKMTVPESTTTFRCSESKIIFLHDYIRGSYYLRGENKRNGFNQFIVNDQSFYFLIQTEKELDQLKKLFTIWYNNNYQFDEFTNGIERYRMILMNQNFDWKTFESIKQKQTQ